jgi:glycine cleavage system aminomethyltransferase T
VKKEDKEAGWITSAVHGQADDGIIAMGFVRRRYLNIGDRLTVDMDGAQMDAEIVGLPFYNNG